MKKRQKLLNITSSIFFCMYKMVDISAETWDKAEVSLIKKHENDDANKVVFLLLCISDANKDGVVKIFMA